MINKMQISPEFSDELYKAAVNVRKQRNKDRRSATKKFSYLMDMDRYIKWERYKLQCLERGEEITFQGVVTSFVDNLV